MKTLVTFFSCVVCFMTLSYAQPDNKLLGDQWGDPVKKVEKSNLSTQMKSKFHKAYDAATEELFGTYNLKSERNDALKAFETAVLNGKGKELIRSSWLKSIKQRLPGRTFEVRKQRFIEVLKRMESETEDE